MVSIAISCSMEPLIVIPDQIDLNIHTDPVVVEPVEVQPIIVEENQSDTLLPPLWRS